MGKNKALIIAVSVLITALIIGAATYFVHVQRIAGLHQQVETLERTNAKLQSTNEKLREQVAALQKQAANGPGEEGKDDVPGLVISRTPRPGWQTYFPDAENTTLLNEPVDRVRKLLGEPPFLIRSIAANPEFNREIWIYMAGEEDPTGLYLFFKANRLVQSRLDEFNGLYNSGLLEYPGFWLN